MTTSPTNATQHLMDVLNQARKIAHERALDPALEVFLTRARSLAGGLGIDLGLSRDMEETVSRDLDRAIRIVAERGFEASSRHSFASPPVKGLSAAIMYLTIRALPAEHRARYAEEFYAEVLNMPRRARFSYAVRLAGRAWFLRRGLTVDLRLTREQHAVLRAAAAMKDEEVSSFLLEAALPKARQILAGDPDMIMPADTFEVFLAELDRPPSVIPELRDLHNSESTRRIRIA